MKTNSRRPFEHARAVLVLTSWVVLNLGLACASSEVDPRCKIDAPSSARRGRIAKTINGSKLWQAFFETVAPIRDVAQPIIGFTLTLNREITQRTNDGDYDPGVVHAYLTVKHLWTGTELYAQQDTFPIKDFVFTESDATREQVQAAAFEATEDTAMRYVHRWVEVAAIRAMKQEGSAAFIPVLEEQMQDPWSDNLVGEAKLALKTIRGN